MSVRDSLVAELRKVVGPERKVHIIPAQDSADVLDRPTIMLKQQRISPLEAAPRANLRIDYVLTFVWPGSDPTTAELELDVWVPDVLDDLKALTWFAWTEARKVLFDPLNMAYDVECYVLTEPDNGAGALAPPAGPGRAPAPVRRLERKAERKASRPAVENRTDVLTESERESHG
jgi:hypothetical protein